MKTETPPPSKHAYGVSRTYGSILLMGARALNAVFNIISVPILLGILGGDMYGAIVFALTIHGLMGLADIGTMEVVQRQMSMAMARDDLDEVTELNRDQLGVNLLSGVILILVGIICGLTIPLSRAGIGYVESFAIFATLGLQSCLYRINQSISTFLAANQRFDLMSLSSALGGLIVTAVSLITLFMTHRPWSFVVGMMVGEFFNTVILYRGARRIGHWALPRPALRWTRLKPVLKLCAFDYPNRLAKYFASWGDKLMLGTATLLDVGAYRNASRVPDALRDMLDPLAGTSLPGFSRDYHHSLPGYKHNVLFTATTVYFAACVAMLVPTGFALPLLHIWLGKNAPAQGPTVMVLMAVFQSFQMYLAVMAIALMAAGKRQLFIPLTASSALVSIFLTLPIYHASGIAGIAGMNATMGVLQVFGIWVLLGAIGFTASERLGHAARILGLFVLMLGFVGLGTWLSRVPPLTTMPMLSLPATICLMAIAFAVTLRLRLARLPDRLERRIPGRLRRLLAV